jgi:hypothetical protein
MQILLKDTKDQIKLLKSSKPSIIANIAKLFGSYRVLDW